MSVSGFVPFEFCRPEVGIAGWHRRSGTAGMSMPETTVHEKSQTMAGEDKIRGAGEVASVKAKSKSHCMSDSPNAHFGSRILGWDLRHHDATRGAGLDNHD
jgi:hypothetical protein